MERTQMYKIRDLFRLITDNKMSYRQIGKVLSIGKSTVSEIARRINATNLSYNNITALSDTQLLELLQMAKKNQSIKYKQLSDQFQYFDKELKRHGVTIKLLWEEYRKKTNDGYSLSQFGHHFQLWRGSTKSTMKLEHKAGDKLLIDFTGKKLSIIDRKTGKETLLEVFAAILPSSGLTYVEAVYSQEKHNLIKSTENALWYMGGVPNAIVPDCLKSAVTNGNKYEPEINRGFKDFAKYYGSAVLPARPYSPKDKAAIEGAVKIIYQRIFAKIRDKIFYSLEEINQEILRLLEEYNNKPMQRTGISRRQMFDDIEKSTLKPLPFQYYLPKKHCKLTVAFTYHIYLSEDKHYYSVPHTFIEKKVNVEYDDNEIEIYYDNMRIAVHKRVDKPNGYTTNTDHMPPNHRFYSEWSYERFVNWASKISDSTKNLIEKVLDSKEHPEQGFKVSLGILNLSNKYGNTNLDKAAKKALFYNTYSFKFIKNILENNLLEIEEDELFHTPPINHKNIRGSKYYINKEVEL